MPLVKIDMWEGRDERIKEDLIKRVTDAVVEVLKCLADAVTIIITDVPKINWGIGGLPSSKM